MNKLRRFSGLLIAAIFIFVVMSGLPVQAGGSFFETIQQADDGNAKANDTDALQRETAHLEQPVQNSEVRLLQSPVKFTSLAEIRIIISDAIKQILSKINLVNLGKKIQTIFLPPTGGSKGQTIPSGGGNSSGKAKPGTDSMKPNPKPPGTKPPVTPPPATHSADLRENMKGRFGINPLDGESKWTNEALAAAIKLLETLPESFRSTTTTIRRDKIFQNARVLGYVRMGIPTVTILDGAMANPALFQRTLVHEFTHTFQARNQNLGKQWESRFWASGRPNPPSVTTYGNSHPLEDMAESVAVYWQNPQLLRTLYPARYEFVKSFVMAGKEY